MCAIVHFCIADTPRLDLSSESGPVLYIVLYAPPSPPSIQFMYDNSNPNRLKIQESTKGKIQEPQARRLSLKGM